MSTPTTRSLRPHHSPDVRRHVRQMTRVITVKAAVPKNISLVAPLVCSPQNRSRLLLDTRNTVGSPASCAGGLVFKARPADRLS